jgi:hypothetical protein
LSPEERQRLEGLGTDLTQGWQAPSPPDRDRQARLRRLLAEVVIAVSRAQACAPRTLRGRGGAIPALDVSWPRSPPPPIRPPFVKLPCFATSAGLRYLRRRGPP